MDSCNTTGLYLNVLPRVAFAGDYFSCANVNSAVVSGERAGREMTTHLVLGR